MGEKRQQDKLAEFKSQERDSLKKREFVSSSTDTLSNVEINDSFSEAAGIGEEFANTLEWVPAYFCELYVLKSGFASHFVNQVTDVVKKNKRFLKRFRKPDIIDNQRTSMIRYSLSQIRRGTLKMRLQQLIRINGHFDCKLPNEHIFFGGKEIKDEETGEVAYTTGCMGKIIAEKIPRSMYHLEQEATIKYIMVREHERALFTKDGRILTVLEAGKHDIINRSIEFEIIEIYYVDIGNLQSRWGTQSKTVYGKGTRTATPATVKLNGTIVVRVNNLNNFLTNLVKNETEYYEGNLTSYVKDKVHQIVNSEISQTDALDVYKDAEGVMLAVKVKANDFFQDVGIELVDLSVGSIKFDETTDEIIQERLRKTQVEGAATDIELDKYKALQEMGIDLGAYVSKEQDIKMVASAPGGLTEKQKAENEIAELEKKIEELDEKLDNKEMSESVWEKRVERLESKIKDLRKKL